MKIKVLLVVGNKTLNGTEKYALDIAANLSKEKFDVCIATPEKGPLSEILKRKNIREFIYHNGRINKFTLSGTKNLYSFIKKEKFDVVHANSGVIPCIVSKLSGVKLILETKHGLFFTEENLKNLSFFTKIHEKIKQHYSDYIIAISQNDKNRLIEYFKIKENKIKIIYNGIDINSLSIYREKKMNLKREENKYFTLGNIGRLTYQKAQEKIIKAANEFKVETDGIKILIIGDGENLEMLNSLIRESKLENMINIVSYKENIYDYFIRIDVLLLTSRFEGIPYVIMESMVLGIPVITTDVGGIGNLIKNGYNGLIVDGDNPVEIKNAVLKYKNDKLFYETIRKNAFETISAYSIDSFIKNYEQLYSISKSQIN